MTATCHFMCKQIQTACQKARMPPKVITASVGGKDGIVAVGTPPHSPIPSNSVLHLTGSGAGASGIEVIVQQRVGAGSGGVVFPVCRRLSG